MVYSVGESTGPGGRGLSSDLALMCQSCLQCQTGFKKSDGGLTQIKSV